MEYLDWQKNVLKYTYYEEKKKDPLRMRCVVAISPNYCVSYAHGSHKRLRVRYTRQNGSVRNGDTVTVYSYESLILNGAPAPIRTEVVHVEPTKDFIILKAPDGTTFFDPVYLGISFFYNY
jgi:hypothetical protein